MFRVVEAVAVVVVAEALVGMDACVVGLVRTFPVGPTLLAGLTPPPAVADANILE